jgi:uncharacterized repeat protein (TIGR04138 family)
MKEGEDFVEKVRALAKKEGRYDFQAYLFVFQALEFTLKRIGKRRHVSGQELLEGIKDFALLNFGAMGKTVFDQWGVAESVDFGRIVFALVEDELMSKTETDDISDFAVGFDFEETFGKNYRPAGMEGEQNA